MLKKTGCSRDRNGHKKKKGEKGGEGVNRVSLLIGDNPKGKKVRKRVWAWNGEKGCPHTPFRVTAGGERKRSVREIGRREKSVASERLDSLAKGAMRRIVEEKERGL